LKTIVNWRAQMRRFFFALLILVMTLPAACGAVPASVTTSGKLKVVATFSVLGDLVHNVGGDRIQLHILVGAGRDTHTYEPTPADAGALAEAALVFENGLEFEKWLDKLYAASGSKAPRIVVTQGLEPLTLVVGDEMGATDPHAWHDVANVIHMVEAIRDALKQADPANAQAYDANAQAYLAQLRELDNWVVQQVKAVPKARRKLVTTHDTFGYFARRYGFEILGTILPTSTEGASPSAQQMARLVEALKASGAPAVFAENVSSNALLDQVAAEAGVKVIASLYTDALGLPGSEGDTYVKMVRYNVTTIVNALGNNP
jgi:zinc/manganese transport system substrate-binding protein